MSDLLLLLLLLLLFVVVVLVVIIIIIIIIIIITMYYYYCYCLLSSVHQVSQLSKDLGILGVIAWHMCPGWGGGHSTKFYTGRLCPKVQPLTLLYTSFDGKGTPFQDSK